MRRRSGIKGSATTGRRPRNGLRQRGYTAIECMISLALGLMVTLASIALLLAAQETYLLVDDQARITDTGGAVLDMLGAAIRQAGYSTTAQYAAAATASALPAVAKLAGHALFGVDDRSEKTRSYYYLSPKRPAINGSDVLYTAFMARHADGSPDRSMRDCGGHAAAGMVIAGDSGWHRSIFFIARAGDGETALYCKYRTQSGGHAADSIARGVEAMQFLYGVDLDGDGLPDTFLNATEINATGGGGHRSGRNRWDDVVAVRIALVVHGSWQRNVGGGDYAYDRAQPPLDLFGHAYSAARSGADPGVHYFPWQLQRLENHLSRQIFRTTVMVRNRSARSIALALALASTSTRRIPDSKSAAMATEADASSANANGKA